MKTLNVYLTGDTIEKEEYYFGFNAQLLRGPLWNEPGFIDKVNSLGTTLIRYPGGTVASYWDWKNGWLMDGVPLRFDWGRIHKKALTLENLKWACDQAGAKPVFVLNMVQSDITSQVEMLLAADSIGLDVKYIEMDNELYLGRKFYAQRFATGKDYAEESNIWIDSIRTHFPDVRIAVACHSYRGPNASNIKDYPARGENWNREVLERIKGVDAVVFHYYSGSGLKHLSRIAASHASSYEDKQDIYKETFNKENTVELILGIPFVSWESAVNHDFRMAPADMPIWITEYNMFEKEGIVAGTWTHALYVLVQTILFTCEKSTGMLLYHNLAASAQFGAIFNDEEGFQKSPDPIPTKKLGLSASGESLLYFGEFMKASQVIRKIRFDDITMLKTIRGKTYPALIGIYGRGANEMILVLNLDKNPVRVNFSEFFHENVRYKMKFTSPHEQITGFNNMNESEGSASVIELMPYSVTLISGN